MHARIWPTIGAVTTQDDDLSKVNWSIRLVGDEASQWDDLLYLLRKETRRRTLSKADIMRALVRLASDNTGPIRQALVGALTHEPNKLGAEIAARRPDSQASQGE